MTEEWKPIEGYMGNYLISNHGRVWSNNSNKVLSTHPNHKGYELVGIYLEGVKRTFSVHRLVAKAFCEGFYEGLHVDHIDTDKLNNKSDNLRWVTNEENKEYALLEGIHPSQIHAKSVRQLDILGNQVNTFKSIKEAHIITGIFNIGDVCLGKRLTAGGYKWELNLK